MQYGRGWAGRRVSMVGEGRGGVAPPLEIGKKDAVRGNFNLFHLCFTYEIRGESIHCTSKVEGWADRPMSIVEGEKWEKNVVRRNFNLFHLCFTNEIRGGGDRYTIHAKWKRVGGHALVHGGRGWVGMGGGGRGGFAPLENEKRKGEYRPQSAVGGK